MQFQLCDNTDFFLRLALLGPSGSGKTFTALRLATELGYEKVAIIDTENRSARRYARQFSQRFMALELAEYSPAHYIEAIHSTPLPPLPARPARPPRSPWRCARCKEPGPKVSRGVLAQQLRDILPQGLPREVRQVAELVARRLDGLCEACATSREAP